MCIRANVPVDCRSAAEYCAVVYNHDSNPAGIAVMVFMNVRLVSHQFTGSKWKPWPPEDELLCDGLS